MKVYSHISEYSVFIPANEVMDFALTWPCSRLRNVPICFTFSKSNGDLIDLSGNRGADDTALAALSETAGRFGAKTLGILDWRYKESG